MEICVTGNIIKERYDDNGILRHGTKEFVGGTKVYLCGKYWNTKSNTIDVIGLDRHHKYRVVSIPTKYIINIRTTRVFKPVVYKLMNGDYDTCFENELIRDLWWNDSNKDLIETESFVCTWYDTANTFS